jgi:antitoxin component of MazEF toxin-antitoxin module/predicted nucleic acid-binding protein
MELKLAKWGNSLALRLPSLIVKSLHLEDGDALQININQLREIVLTPTNSFDKSAFLLKLQAINGKVSSYQIPKTKRHAESPGIIYVDSSVMVSMLSDKTTTESCINWFCELETMPICGECLIAEFNSAIALMQKSGQLTDDKLKLIISSFDTLIKGGVKLLPVSRDVFKQSSELMHTDPDMPIRSALHLGIALASEATEYVTLDIEQYQYAKNLGLACRLLN